MSLPPNILEALQTPSNTHRTISSSILLSSFRNHISSVSTPLTDADPTKSITNKFDLLCPRGDCGSVILLKMNPNTSLVEEEGAILMEPLPTPHSSPSPHPQPQQQWWWHISSSSPMIFENIAFTLPVVSPTDKKFKFLACAECDLGPLGYYEEGGTVYYLASDRVAYRVP